jgi:predicted dehydrogenase
VELKNNQQAAWRVDPLKNGRGGSIGDIGTHAYHLAGYVTGLKAQSVLADLATFVEGRALDDNAHVLIRYEGGARGMLWSSQVAIGCANAASAGIWRKRQFDLVPGAAQRTGFHSVRRGDANH